MQDAGSPWAGSAAGLYSLIEAHDHDPAVWLAIGLREHRLLTDPRAVALKLNTNSWTNARSIRHPDVDGDLMTTDDLRAAGITDREGPYVRYRSVADSLLDGMYRIDDPSYVYWQNVAVDIGRVLRLWTESEADQYIDFVTRRLSEWMPENAISWLDAPGVPYWPELAGEFGYPPLAPDRGTHDIDQLIIHTTEGTDSFGWLRGANRNSVHYLSHPNSGRPRAQLLDERLAGWTAGNELFNQRSIQYEIEGFAHRGFAPHVYREAAEFCATIIERHPAILPDRHHVIGHNEVPDPNNLGRYGGAGNHTDPGPLWDWNMFMAYLHEALDDNASVTTDDHALFSEATGHWIIDQTVDGLTIRMLDYWREQGGIERCGHPLTGMTRDDDGVYRQLFENVLIEAWPEGFGPYPGVHLRLGGLGQRYHQMGTSNT